MTTQVTIENINQGKPYADWSVELIGPDGNVEHTLAPGESITITLWHDGRALTVREKPEGVTVVRDDAP